MGSGPSGAAMKLVAAVMTFLSMVVFLGYMMIWSMKSTNTFYLHWWPDVLKKTSSTYLGEQGTTTLIYAFPILFIATIGSLYLHLEKKYDHDHSTRFISRIILLKRPVITKGPLGIVSWTELTFLAMFVALLVWSMYSYTHNMFAFAALEAAQEKFQVWEVKLRGAALSLGLAGNACLAFLFFPVTRGSSILQFVGLTSEASIKYHIWLGNITMVIFTAHGLSYITYWSHTHQISQMLKWDKFMVSNVAGEIALLAGLVMCLYVMFVIFYVFHVGFAESCLILPGFYLFLIDRYLRSLQSQQKVRSVAARILPCETVELNFSKNSELSYAPTSIAFINVPSISRIQWHPFTVTSNSNMDSDKLSIVIKREGSWSHKLYQILSSPSTNRLEVAIEGPYGPPSTNFTRYERLVLVSGGSGITPFISIIREIIFKCNTTSSKTPRIHLICAFKKYVDLTMLDLLLPVSGTTLDLSRLLLQIEAYITRETQSKTENQNSIRTILFRPHQSDRPVSAVLGPNSWLWLGAIISSSFIIFLILIGLLTRFYIYPIDHNTNMKHPVPASSAFNMLFVCIAITIAASAAFLWNKGENAKESSQIRTTDMSTPAPSPTSLVSETELESLPHQSLRQATTVHLGQRPNLKKILSEYKEEKVGVYVSGPRKMRQEVAAICSSSADNLHFESISFSW
ncbi:PREDICTED: ferric reduction oxidase 2-like isoform X2 [Populus euphratica]|uniref:ferric-chelate reductase (NADH) n=1 Tax=Populus euphratica TaxID=75702 RepID=A0AAJ6V9U9_POPEU|nr:PREDICTED: ferric reduction oxidase 2-like isoform X2 [Populus euphratica]